MLVSGCELLSKPVEGVDSSLGDGIGNENFFLSELVQSIGISHPESLEDTDLNYELIENIIPSFFGRSIV